MQVESGTFITAIKPVLQRFIQALAQEYGYCSVLAEDNTVRNIEVSGSGVSVSESGRSCSRGFVARVADSKGYAEYSFNDITEESIPAVIETLRTRLTPLTEGLPAWAETSPTAVTGGESRNGVYAAACDTDPLEMNPEDIIAKFSGIRERCLKGEPRLVDCIIYMNCQKIHKLFLTPDTALEQHLLWTSAMAIVLARGERGMQQAFADAGGSGGFELTHALEERIPAAVRTVLALTEAEPIVPGEYPCVCTPLITGLIVHEAFGHGLEMDMFVKDRAKAKYCVGERVASDLVTMHDGAAAIPHTGTYFFDDEGVAAQNTVTIEKGILKRGISDAVSAATLGTVPTGNGRRETFRRKAYTRMTNTYFEPGHDTPEEMIASIDYGFLLDIPGAGMEDPKNWGMQIICNAAFEIKDGKLTGKVFSPVFMTGYVPDVLKSISMMSADFEMCGIGSCGKGHKEWVKVSTGGPYIKANIRLG